MTKKKASTTQTTEAAEQLAKHIVQSPLEHDGDRYEIGETVELTPADAATLIACGVVIAAPSPPPNGDGESNQEENK